jgi:FixJ family two-component response regulator
METVFLVDDDPAVLRSLSRVLREGGWDVEAFDSAEAFLARADQKARGCLVLDVTMPGLDGLELQRRLTEAGHALPIVFLTGHGDIPMSVQAIKAGATDFLTKPVASEALLGAVRAAIEKEVSARRVRAEIAGFEQRLATLTPREREVLAAVAKGRLNKQIAGDLGIVEQTVKFHRARIMERMQARTVAELVHIAAKLGLEALPREPGAAPHPGESVTKSTDSRGAPTGD